MKNNVV